MPYGCELKAGQRVYLDCSGSQTIVMLFSSSPGQQQQSSSRFQTGAWTAPPDVFQAPHGLIIRISTAQGNRFVQIQGSSMSVIEEVPALNQLRPIQVQSVESESSAPVTMPLEPLKSMEPMSPMKPMTIGDMQMSLNPMEIRMGNLSMRMPSTSSPAQRFCSQCGTSVKSDDRFCSSCGHHL